MRNLITPARTGLMSARGFTLIELLLVLVILSVLAMLVVPRFTGRTEQTKVTGARTDISQIGLALDSFEVDCGRYPTTEEGLRALIERPATVKGWMGGPYLKNGLPVDPWGSPYQYRSPGQHHPDSYDLWSFGKDNADGGGDDVDNWTPKTSE